MDFVEIPLNGKRGGVALVSSCDAERVRSHRWYHDVVGYARSYFGTGRRNKIEKHLHRFILGDPPFPGAVVDHTNRNKLDNRRENLRWVSRGENNLNKGADPVNRNGVYRIGHVWHAFAGRKYVGCFRTCREARAARVRTLEVSHARVV